LIYRLVHYHDPIPDIDIDLRAREKQLWKPLLRVFHQNGPKAFDVLDKVVTEYVEEYRQQKSHTQTAFLVRMISELGEEKSGLTLAISDIWNKYKEKLPGGEEIGKTSYRSNEYGDMSQKRLSELLRDQFKARPPKHHGDRRQLVFDKTALDRMKQKYRININKNNAGTDGTDGSDIGLDIHLSEVNSDSKTSKNIEGNVNTSSQRRQADTNQIQQNTDQSSVTPDNASQASQVSQTQTDDNNSSNKKNDPDAYWTKGKWERQLTKGGITNAFVL
jgi:hypothetical protein